jgi:O-antigen/teichoic acid export membrane protein
MSNNNKNVADISALLTLSRALDTAIGIAAAMITVRYLSKESYAVYLQIMFLLNLVVMILTFGMPRSVYYFFPRVKDRKKFVLFSLLICNLLSLLFFIIICFFGNYLLSYISKTSILPYIYFLAIYIMLSSNGQIVNSVLMCNQKGKLLAVMSIIFSFISFIFTIIPVIFGLDLYGLFGGLLIAYIIRYIINGYLSLTTTSGNLSAIKKPEYLKDQLKYMLPIGFTSIIIIISSSVDRMIISLYMDVQNFAFYDRGAMQIPILSSLSISVGSAILPSLVFLYKENRFKDFLKYWHNSIEKIALVIFPSFSLFYIIAYQIITLLYTEAFSLSVPVFKIYLFNFLTTITIFGNIFNASNKNIIPFWIQLFICCVAIPISIILIRNYGIIGAAFASILKNYMETFLNIVSLSYVLNISIRNIFPWRILTKNLFLAILSGIIPYFISNTDYNKIVIIFICSIVYFISYIFLIDKFHLLQKEDKLTVIRWLKLNKLKKSSFIK